MDAEKFEKDRKEIFASLDKEKITGFFNKYGLTVPEDEELFWMIVHKTISGDVNIPRDIRLRSVRWLLDIGSSHFMADITEEEFAAMLESNG